jgi:2-phosphoglycerate kinase
MRISDSFLRAHLRNVYWIGGAAYGGKTTVTDLLAHRYGFQPYHPEDLFHEHKQAASPEDHPALFAPFHGYEWFFNRPLEDYIKALEGNFREQLEMVILDLVKLNAGSKVVVEGCLLDPWLVSRLTEHNKCLFLYADEEVIRNGFFARKDKQDLLDVINTLNDPGKTHEHVLDVSCAASTRARAEAEAAGVKVLVRNAETDLQETLTEVEQHFGLA